MSDEKKLACILCGSELDADGVCTNDKCAIDVSAVRRRALHELALRKMLEDLTAPVAQDEKSDKPKKHEKKDKDPFDWLG
jgi:hypothetical protein